MKEFLFQIDDATECVCVLSLKNKENMIYN